jgi:chromate transporter
LSTESADRVGPATAWLEIFPVFLKLGCTSFGGPIAHIGYFHYEFVERRKWASEQGYADLVALCNFLPGPASSQVGIALGLTRGGIMGALAAWVGFTAPSALALMLFAYAFMRFGFAADAGWLHGLKVVAVAVIAQAIWGMGRNLCPDRTRASMALLAALIVLWQPSAFGQIAAIVLGGLVGWRWIEGATVGRLDVGAALRVSRGAVLLAWVLFFLLLTGLPLLSYATHNHAVALFDSFYRTGSLVFGGGHVVLPLLRNEVVPPGWVTDDVFLAGYGAAQAVPGPLFTFSAFLGTVNSLPPRGWLGGLLALVAIFLPGFLLVVGALPYWQSLRHRPGVQSVLRGVNAAVVGLLLAAFYNPVWSTTIRHSTDLSLALIAFGLLMFWKVSPFYVVIVTAVGGAVLSAFA